MHFSRVRPTGGSASFVEWYWTTKSDNPAPQRVKIIPDGFPEMVFHYGDPYRIWLKGRWRRQGRFLLGGQLTQHCFLENTGRSEIFGITFKPAALTHLFSLPMKAYAGNVVNLATVPGPWKPLITAVFSRSTQKERIAATELFFKPYHTKFVSDHPVEKCLAIIQQSHGTRAIKAVCEETGVTERQIERLFARYIGLSPKYFARILRFNHIFHLIQKGQVSWADVVHLSGYYDQSHFIRDFKRFTGEDPTAFSFREKSLTNFFAWKSDQE